MPAGRPRGDPNGPDRESLAWLFAHSCVAAALTIPGGLYFLATGETVGDMFAGLVACVVGTVLVVGAYLRMTYAPKK